MSVLKEKFLQIYPELIVLGTGVAAFIYDSGIDKNPRAYNPIIENHFGNLQWGLLLSELAFIVSRGLGVSKIKSAITSLVIPIGITLAAELLTPNNYEFAGDVLVGAVGSLIAVSLLSLLPRPNPPS